jgi:hypothetical protein
MEKFLRWLMGDMYMGASCNKNNAKNPYITEWLARGGGGV